MPKVCHATRLPAGKGYMMRINFRPALRSTALMMLWSLGSSTVASAEPMSKEQGDAILTELRQIRQLLQRQQAPSQAQGADETATVTIGGFPILGKPDAPLTMVLFTDYQCPYCSKFETQTLPEIKRQYIDTGKLRFVVRDLPLAFHPNAAKAAEATYCAEDQGKFWELREKLVTHTGRLEEKNLSEYAEMIGLDPAKFNACLTGGRHGEKVKQSQAEAATQKITGTPTFVVGRTAGDKVSGVRVVGAQPFASFDQKLKDMLKAMGK